jgi:hypothetical protein
MVSKFATTDAANIDAEIVIDESGNSNLTGAPSMRDAAFELAAEGFRVFPLPPRQKRATMEKWQLLATTDRDQVATWFPIFTSSDDDDLLSCAEPNIAIATGHGLLVLDEDPRHGSVASVAALQLQHAKLPETRVARTPSGGRHRYYRVLADRHVANSAGKLGAGLDVRGDGGYVAAPPSLTDAGVYTWENAGQPIADAPAWLIELATKPKVSKEATPNNGADTAATPTHDLKLADARAMLGHIKLEEGEYQRWFEVLVALRRMAKGVRDGSTEADYLALADEWSQQQPGYTGIAAVQAKWLEADKRERGYGLGHLIKLAVAGGWHPPGRMADVDAFKNDTLGSSKSEASAGERQLIVDPAELPSLTLQRLPLDWHNIEPTPRRWIVGVYLSAETSTLLISLGGLGKSYLILYLSMCVALGIDFFEQSCEQGRVVIVSGEDDFNEVWRRLLKLVRHLGLLLPPRAVETLRENIEVVDVKQWRRARGASPVLTKSDRGGAILTPFVGHIARRIGRANLVVFDTVSRFNGAEENSNDAMARLVDAFEIISEETHSAVLALAHTGIKGKGGAVDQYSSRGASALSDNSRSVTVLAPLDGELINQLSDVQQQQKASRNDLLRLCHVKANYARKLDDVYFERHAHGVLVPTQLTLQGAMTEAELVERLLARVGIGAVTRNQMRELAPELPATRAAAFAAFDTAVSTGRLVHGGTYRGSTQYRVKWAEATPVLLAANSDLIGE